ncbi:YaiI/YqxD family protein [Kiloniella laminariae]|uniref:YaiI/YqxD family protein n=1 Tax=Kiloniella laminariae TaxID=454162 RepID=UPI00035CD933|nr:YaiI/YqxD family protein [Kiloniella laminariae]
MEIYVDGDACPVKDEVIRVAERHGLQIHLVSNSWLRYGRHPLVNSVVVPEGLDVADDWIADNIKAGDIAVTADIPLASRCVKQGAKVLDPKGKIFTEESMGMTLAVRDLMTNLRESGEIKSYSPAFTKQDRSRFLSALDQIIHKK